LQGQSFSIIAAILITITLLQLIQRKWYRWKIRC